MSPKVTYWSGVWDPHQEAISKEIAQLRTGPRANAPVVAISPTLSPRLRLRDRALTLPEHWWPVFRTVAAMVEVTGDVTHIFGGQASWHQVRALGRRPIVLTAVASGRPGDRLPHVRFGRVVVETEDAIDEWLRAGVAADRIAVIPPGIDTDRFRPTPAPPTGPFTLLFASTPEDPGEINARGVSLLVDLARARPDVRIVVPWRQWGDVAAARRALDALGLPPNFVVRHETGMDMPRLYAEAHATVVAFDPACGKSVPNFVLEGLASGRPCIAAYGVPIAATIAAEGAGEIGSRDVRGLGDAIDRLRNEWPAAAGRARNLAEARFSLTEFLAGYESIYADVASTAAD